MLQIEDLHSRLGETPILRGVNLRVLAGEVHVIVGANGSGKSTLGRVLLGDEQHTVTQGTVTLGDADLLALEPHERAQAGFFLSFQSPPAIDGVSAVDLLHAGAQAASEERVSHFRFKKQLGAHLRTVHLGEEFVNREIHKGASGGERRKLELASMLALEPKLAFLDEVDSGVDIDGIHAMADALRQYMAGGGRGLVIVSHGERLLDHLAPTHVHVMADGQLVESGDATLLQRVKQEGFAQRKGALERRGIGTVRTEA